MILHSFIYFVVFWSNDNDGYVGKFSNDNENNENMKK